MFKVWRFFELILDSSIVYEIGAESVHIAGCTDGQLLGMDRTNSFV